ncbi:hypothetical protein [Luteolibacter sp. LG18]|uniref:hypothetical protein n=1 Tax=Luteolibacter sp. LG18 TaxID=2819286 RepID=UPI002B2AF6D7|nr:hypothetical protein llg_14420 [Luteolibacter sp. LG18]
MKRHLVFTLATLAGFVSQTHGQAQVLVDSTTYPNLFNPANSQVTVVPNSTLGNLFGLNGTASGALGTYWQADVNGGAIVVAVASTGAQAKLTGSALQFNVSNDPNTVLGSLGAGLSIDLSWAATATFNASGATLNLQPNSTYRVSFDVVNGQGLLNSGLGISPTFGVSLLNSQGNAIGVSTGGSVANILGLTLVNQGATGRATVDFKTGASVPAGAAKLKFTGSANLPISVGALGTTFATVSNVSVSYVSPYTLYVESQGITTPAAQDPNADPDGDGRNNLGEFAFNSNANVSDGGNQHYAIGDPDGGGPETSAFVYTFPVRNGATFAPNGNTQLATVDGVHYQVEGSYDLASWTQAVSEVTPNGSYTSALPALQTGWGYRSFRVAGQTTNTPKAFLRVRYY